MLDVVVIGAGPAGLSAALILGRCRRRVLVCSAGHPRNSASQALHGFLTRDGFKPLELLHVARTQLLAYDSVETRDVEATNARRLDDHFEVILSDRTRIHSRKLLLATGVVDSLPQVDGI